MSPGQSQKIALRLTATPAARVARVRRSPSTANRLDQGRGATTEDGLESVPLDSTRSASAVAAPASGIPGTKIDRGASANAGCDVRARFGLTYGDDVGQSGWVTRRRARAFRGLAPARPATRASSTSAADRAARRAPGGGTGAESSASTWSRRASPPRRRLADERGLADRARFVRADAGGPLPLRSDLDAVVSIDVMCHLPDRRDPRGVASRDRAGSHGCSSPTRRSSPARHRHRARGPERGGDLRLFRRVRQREAARARPDSRSSAAKISPRTWPRWPAAGTTRASVFGTAWWPTRE